MITLDKKREIYNKYKDLIDFIYIIADKVIIKRHLSSIIELFNNCNTYIASRIVEDLTDYELLKVGGLIKGKDIVLYLSKPAIGLIIGRTSREVSSFRVTDSKVMYSIYKISYILQYILPKLEVCSTIELRRYLSKLKSTLAIGKNNTSRFYNFLNKKFKGVMSDKFNRDLNFFNYADNIKRKDSHVIPEWKAGYDLRTNDILKYEKTHSIEDNYKLKYFYTINNLVSANFFINSIIWNDSALNVTIGFFDINNTKDSNNIYKNIAYIYNMLIDYFDIYKAKITIKLECEIYTCTEDRAKYLRQDSKAYVRDFIGYKKYPKMQNAIWSAYKRVEYLENITVSFKSLNI